MKYYAEIDSDKLCFSVKMVKSYILRDDHIEIESLNDDYLNRKYENGVWSTEKYVQDASAIQLTEFEELKRQVNMTQASQAATDTTLLELMETILV